MHPAMGLQSETLGGRPGMVLDPGSPATAVKKSARRTQEKPEEKIAIELSPGPRWLRRTLGVIGGLYIAAVFCEGAGWQLSGLLWRPLLFFCQIAALFPHAATHTIEYRAEGYTCNSRIVEIDVRPYFPIHADDKESRFDRAMFFYRTDKPTMEALEAYVMREYNKTELDKIGGVAFMSLRIPIPPPGSSFPRYERVPLADHPKEQRKVWYVTPHDLVMKRCKEGAT
jgi:hypothetical protein